MSQIFINLAVSDLAKSVELYSGMGFINNPQFSDDSGKCMVWNEHIMVMILTHEKFKSFATRPLADTRNEIAAIYSLSVENLDKINQIVDGGLEAGAIEPTGLKDYGFMQQRTLEDFDGHTWEIFCMDISKFPQPGENPGQ